MKLGRRALFVLLIVSLLAAARCSDSTSVDNSQAELTQKLTLSRDRYLGETDESRAGELARAHDQLVHEHFSKLGLRLIPIDLAGVNVSTNNGGQILQIERRLVKELPTAVAFDWDGVPDAEYFDVVNITCLPLPDGGENTDAKKIRGVILDALGAAK